MIRTIIGFLLALVAIGIFSGFINIFIGLPLMFIGRKTKSLAPIKTFLASVISMFLALIIFIYICGFLEIQPTYLMFILPYFLVITNNFRRINNASQGRSKVEEMLGEEFDSKLQVNMEYGYLIGHVLGFLLFYLTTNKLSVY